VSDREPPEIVMVAVVSPAAPDAGSAKAVVRIPPAATTANRTRVIRAVLAATLVIDRSDCMMRSSHVG
jgi:hypothetical protein